MIRQELAAYVPLADMLVKTFGQDCEVVLHDLGQAMEVSDHVVVIQNGRKYSEGAPEEVITSQMMKEVYGVDCEIAHIPGRKKPLIVYKELGQQRTEEV